MSVKDRDLERGIECGDDEIGGDAAEALAYGRSRQPLHVEALKRLSNSGAVFDCTKALGQDVGILYRLAASLSEVGHHGVN
jgi:hypothetical protein